MEALLGAVSQPHAVQRSQRLLLLLGTEHAQRATPARHAAKKAQQHVVQHTEAVDQVELLKDVADVGTQAPYVAVKATRGLHFAP